MTADYEVLRPRLYRLGYRLTGAQTLPERCRWQVAKGFGGSAMCWYFSSLEAVQEFVNALPERPPVGFVA